MCPFAFRRQLEFSPSTLHRITEQIIKAIQNSNLIAINVFFCSEHIQGCHRQPPKQPSQWKQPFNGTCHTFPHAGKLGVVWSQCVCFLINSEKEFRIYFIVSRMLSAATAGRNSPC